MHEKTYPALPAARINPLTRIFYLVIALIISLNTLGLSVASGAVKGEPAVEQTGTVSPVQQGFAPGVLLVGLKPGADLQSSLGKFMAHAASDQAEATSTLIQSSVPLFPFASKFENDRQYARVSQADDKLSRVYKLHLSPNADVLATAALLRTDADIEFAEPDFIARASQTPNDPLYGDQWGLAKIGAQAAWDISTGDPAVTIAIVDSGVDLTHQDLANQLWINPGEVSGNGLDDDGNGLVDDVHGWNFLSDSGDVSDENGHGTQVAGVAAAATNNGVGIAGMCWSCRFMAVKVMQASGTVNYSDIAAGVAYAAGQGAQVINLSLGGYADSEALRTAIESAAATTVIVAGAGNDNQSTPFYPAAYPEVIAAAAGDQNDVKASFSNYGGWVDISAPGVGIETTFAGNNAYGLENGTSLSAPFAAGLAGLIKSLHSDWSPALVRQQIIKTATEIDGINPSYAGQLGNGRINAAEAMASQPQPDMAVTGWSVDGQIGARPAPGQTFDLVLTLQNEWLPARNVIATLSESDAYASITDAGGVFGDLNTGQSASNSSDPFRITLLSNTPYNHPIPFKVQLSASDGYSLNLDFTLSVRSGIEQVPGGTTYIADETWTSDKSYVLLGNVIIDPGVTLTIQPGTMIKVNAGSWLRVDGTLLADGTEDQPIVFTTNSEDNSKWAGLRFTDNSGEAVFDENGDYASGSILRHVDLSYAETGVSMLGKVPYIADSQFSHNNTAVNSGTWDTQGGSLYLERNKIDSNSIGIQINGGNAYIAQNTITNNSGNAIHGSGSPTVISNTITNNYGWGMYFGCCNTNAPLIEGNYIVGNGNGIRVEGLQGVNIEHNLIANNTNALDPMMGDSAGLYVDVSSTGNSQVTPALAYNPDQNEYLLIWSEFDSMGQAVKIQRLKSDGQAASSAVTIGYGYVPDVVYNDTQHEYLAAWSNDNMTAQGFSIRRILSDGVPVNDVDVFQETNWVDKINLIFQSAENSYLVVWQDNSNWPNKISALHILTDGTQQGEPFAIGSDLGSSSLALGNTAYDPGRNRSLVTFRSDNSNNRIYGAWVDATQEIITPIPSVILAQDTEWKGLYNPTTAYGSTADRFFTAWERDENYPERTIYGQVSILDSTLTFSQTFVYSDTGTYSSWPKTSYSPSNNEFLVVWSNSQPYLPDGQDSIYGQRITPDGMKSGNSIPISTPGPGNRIQNALAYNSNQNEYLIAWVDYRSGTGRLFGQRLNSNGRLLDNAWTAADESDPAVNFALTQGHGIRYNTIFNNSGYGVSVGGGAASQVPIDHNNCFSNEQYDLYMRAQSDVTITNNYWGEIPESQIPARIYDCNDTEFGCGSSQTSIGRLAWNPPLDTPDQTAPAFVQSVNVNPDPVGFEQGSFTVNFSRPMITSTLPLMSFHDIRRGTIESISEVKCDISTMAIDTLGHLWFGGNMGDCQGVLRYDGKAWEVISTSNSGLEENSVSVIYGAANGDVWFGYSNGGVGRLRGTNWTTYTPEITNYILSGMQVVDIEEDASGKIWFANWDTAISFDGVTWKNYMTDLDLTSVTQIARDGQGRMWFRNDNRLSVFDGNDLTIYDKTNGLPSNQINSIFGDSRGRIWAGITYYDNVNWENSTYLGMFENNKWTFFGPKNTNGSVNCEVWNIDEDPDGSVWFSSMCGSPITYDGSTWEQLSNQFTLDGLFMFDLKGNMWMRSFDTSTNSYLKVMWGGEDYPIVDNSQWLSPAQFRTSYDVTPLIPKGTYVVQVDGAAGLDGMQIAPDSSTEFVIDYAGFVSDDTPPSRPQVTARNDGSLSAISVNWSSNDPEGIGQYRYALGTTTGGQDLLPWKYASKTTTSVNLTGLLLVEGQTYYAAVQAQNLSGLWSEVGVSNPVIAGQETVIYTVVTLPLVIR